MECCDLQTNKMITYSIQSDSLLITYNFPFCQLSIVLHRTHYCKGILVTRLQHNTITIQIEVASQARHSSFNIKRTKTFGAFCSKCINILGFTI